MIHQITDIIIYPIKGLAGIHMDRALALEAGFDLDRRWMLVDEEGRFITQRTKPELALFKQNIFKDTLTISFYKASFSFEIKSVSADLLRTKVWDDLADTVVVSKEADEWFSDQLSLKVRLVKIASECSRYHHSKTTDKEYPVSLADGYPYLLVGSSSLELLNENLTHKVSMDRFRPNIVVTTSAAHEEDDWQQFSISSAAFANIKPCGRCNVITIDQSNAKIDTEPLKALNNYRKKDNSVLFGTNLVCIHPGTLKVGDSLQFLK